MVSDVHGGCDGECKDSERSVVMSRFSPDRVVGTDSGLVAVQLLYDQLLQSAEAQHSKSPNRRSAPANTSPSANKHKIYLFQYVSLL